MVFCAVLTNSRIILFKRFRSTARLANFLATAIPRSGFRPPPAEAKYKPQNALVLGRVFSNSEILALFNEAFKRLGVYDLLRGGHLIRRVRFWFSCEYENRGCAYDVLLRVGMFFS